MSSFYALVCSAECRGIQILTIRYFNSFVSDWPLLVNCLKLCSIVLEQWVVIVLEQLTNIVPKQCLYSFSLNGYIAKNQCKALFSNFAGQ
jgi:hypothetical protein